MTAHSPGPWRWEPRIIDGDHWMVLVNPEGRPVLHVPVVDNTAGLSTDARLIAAAPELLEHLRQWLELHGTETSHLAADTRALIARMEGKP